MNLVRGRTVTRHKAESDVEADTDQARLRRTGGKAHGEQGDDNQTTGTGPNDMFVGRASGDDTGPVGDTGAERRAMHRDNES